MIRLKMRKKMLILTRRLGSRLRLKTIFHNIMTSNPKQDQTSSYKINSSGEENGQMDRRNSTAQAQQVTRETTEDISSLTSYYSFRTPASNLSPGKTISCSDEDKVKENVTSSYDINSG